MITGIQQGSSPGERPGRRQSSGRPASASSCAATSPTATSAGSRSARGTADRCWCSVSAHPTSNGPRQPDQLPHSPVFFNCADIEKTYGELRERGVEFPVSPQQQHFGWWSLFEDPEGTRYALGQWE